MKRTRILASLLAGALMIGLAGCAGGTQSSSAAAPDAATDSASDAPAAETDTPGETGGEAATLEFYAWLDEEGIFTKLSDLYKEQNSGVDFNMHFVPTADYEAKLLTAFSGGADIDVFAVASPPSLAAYQSKGAVMALDDLIAKNSTDTSGFQSTFDAIKMEDKAWALPYKTSSWVVYYNKDIFDAAGVEYPADSWTWEEYYETAGKLTSGEGSGKIFGALNYQPTSLWWRVPANTKRSNNPLEPAMLEDWLQAAEFNLSLSQAGYQPDYADRADEAGADYTGAFLQGKYAMMYNGDWCIEMLNSAIADGETLNYDIAAIPHWEGETPETTGAPGLLLLAANAKNVDAGYGFISYCAGAEGAKVLVENDYFPAWQSEEIVAAYTSGITTPEHIAYIVNQDINSQVPCDPLYNAAVNTVVKEEVNLYLLEEQDLATTKANIERRFASELEQ